MDMDFVCTFELEYGRMFDFSRIIIHKTYVKTKKGNEFQKMTITYKRAYFGTDVKDGQYVFEYDKFVQLLHFLKDNIYIKCG